MSKFSLDGRQIAHDIAVTLENHEYRFGGDTNCICGWPSIWTWEDYTDHMSWILAEVLQLNIQTGLNDYVEPPLDPT